MNRVEVFPNLLRLEPHVVDKVVVVVVVVDVPLDVLLVFVEEVLALSFLLECDR